MTKNDRRREPRDKSDVCEAAICDGAVLDRAGKGSKPRPFPLPYKIPRGGMYAAAPMPIPGKRIGLQFEKIGSQIVVAVLDAAGHGRGFRTHPDRRQFHAAGPFRANCDPPRPFGRNHKGTGR
jgi:hypothetical protein